MAHDQQPGSREDRMVVLRRGPDGVPTVWCDPEIADLVGALNHGGVPTVASCSGHGHRPGSIALKDGRWLVVAYDDGVYRRIEALFPRDINGAELRPVGTDLRSLAARAVPFLRDEGAKYADDGSNEPLELARDIEQALSEHGGGGEAVAWRIFWSPAFPDQCEVTTDRERVERCRACDGPPRIEPLYTTPPTPSAPVVDDALLTELDGLEGIRRSIGGTPELGALYRERCATFVNRRYAELKTALSGVSAPVGVEAVEMSPEFTDSARAALAWVLYHHQGGSSPVGQPIRFALGMGAHEPLTDSRIAEAKRWAAWAGATTADFHAALTPPAVAPRVEGGLAEGFSYLIDSGEAKPLPAASEDGLPEQPRARTAMPPTCRELLHAVNQRMHPGSECPYRESIGECPAMSPWSDANPDGPWWAVLSIWDDAFNDHDQVVKWFEEAGAKVTEIEHTLWDADNGYRNGRDPDSNSRPWIVTFVPPPNVSSRSAKPARKG